MIYDAIYTLYTHIIELCYNLNHVTVRGWIKIKMVSRSSLRIGLARSGSGRWLDSYCYSLSCNAYNTGYKGCAFFGSHLAYRLLSLY